MAGMNSPVPGGQLPAGPARSLADCEEVIRAGLATFVEVGTALAEVRDRRLYKDAGYVSFAEYCAKRWGFGRQRAYRLIDGAAVAELVSPAGVLPNERVARELVPLARVDESAVGELWRELRARHGDHLTSDVVREVVAGVLAGAGGSDQVAEPAAGKQEPSFAPVPPSQVPRLDRRAAVACPACGHEFHLPR